MREFILLFERGGQLVRAADAAQAQAKAAELRVQRENPNQILEILERRPCVAVEPRPLTPDS